jgi:Ca-activated chloride channel family protein
MTRRTNRFFSRPLRVITSLSFVSALALTACGSKGESASYPDTAANQAPTGMVESRRSAPADGDDEVDAMLFEGEAEEQASPEPMALADEEAPRSEKAERKIAGKNRRPGRTHRSKKKSGKMGIAGGGYAHQPSIAAPPPATPEFHTEAYDHIAENDYKAVADDPLSTFSIDVDTASYSNTRRYLNDGSLPPADAVRIEEMINYFSYQYPQPQGDQPFSVTTEVSDCPWNPDARLVHVGLKGKTIATHKLPPRNLVFLLDVSGSMNDPRKLPLLKQSLKMLTGQLDGRDRVSIVVYAGASGVVLEPTSGNAQGEISDALSRLSAGGSTNGGAGIELAYKLAQRNFVKDGINRVILATDGDFNVGTTSRGELERLIEKKRKSGVFLSVLGFGTGNVKDSQMEMLADKGNGNYAYIDSAREANKVLVNEAGSTLVTIAKDVKIQVEFNPKQVASYRLVGYENRKLAHKDFNDDTKDAGEIGAGHTVTALYEVIPASQGAKTGVDALRYQHDRDATSAANSGELMLVKLRYKRPRGSRSKLISYTVRDTEVPLAKSSENFRFSAAVAEFGMLLRGSKHTKTGSFQQVKGLAKGAVGNDSHGYRQEFLALVNKAARLKGEDGPAIAR